MTSPLHRPILVLGKDYLKHVGVFPKSKTAKLLQVFKIDSTEISKQFLDYNNTYLNKERLPRLKQFEVEGPKILLIFEFPNENRIFTEIIEYEPEIYGYFQGLQGTWMNVEFKEADTK